MMRVFKKISRIISSLGLIVLVGCAAPKNVPVDLATLKSPEELGMASSRAYQEARMAEAKDDKLRSSRAGILYAQKCLKKNPKALQCLYYEVLNTGTYIKYYIPNYQKGLKKMVDQCSLLINIEPAYENAGCYRVLGNIYVQVPSFSLSKDGITRDIDLSIEYLNKAVTLAPQHALNHLFLAKSLLASDALEAATQHLQIFDQLKAPQLDQEYPDWKKERDNLAKKLHMK